MLGIPDNGAVLLANLAGLAFMQRKALEIRLGVMIPEVQFQNPANDLTTANQKYYPMPFSGYVDPRPDSKWSWGFGLSVVGGIGAEYHLQHELFKDEKIAIVGASSPAVERKLFKIVKAGSDMNRKTSFSRYGSCGSLPY
ncbi:MAG: hypothetical protein ACE5HS_06720 [bacterium]